MRAEYSPLVLTSPDAPDKRDGICPTYPTEDIKKTPNNRCLFGVSCFEEDSLDILHLSVHKGMSPCAHVFMGSLRSKLLKNLFQNHKAYGQKFYY